MSQKPLLAIVTLSASALVWASHNIAGAWLTDDLHPVLANLARTTLATLFYVPILAHYRGRVRFERRHLFRLFGAAASLAAFFQLFYLALWLTSASHVAILLALGPAVTAGLAVPYLGERLPARALLGLVTALVSALVLGLVQAKTPGASQAWWGAAAAFVGMVAFAHYTLLSKPLLVRYPAPFVLGCTITLGSVLLWVCVAPFFQVSFTAFSQVTFPQWLAFAYIAFFMNVLSYIGYNQALRHLPAGTTHAIVVYATTIFALIMARTILGDAVPLTHWICAVAIAVGVWLAATAHQAPTGPVQHSS